MPEIDNIQVQRTDLVRAPSETHSDGTKPGGNNAASFPSQAGKGRPTLGAHLNGVSLAPGRGLTGDTVKLIEILKSRATDEALLLLADSIGMKLGKGKKTLLPLSETLTAKPKSGNHWQYIAEGLTDSNYPPEEYRPEMLAFALLAMGYNTKPSQIGALSPDEIDDLAETEVPDPELRVRVYEALLSYAEPAAGSHEARTEGTAWLDQEMGIDLATQQAFGVCYIEDWIEADRKMKSIFTAKTLEALGLLNDDGDLRFGHHRLLFPFWLQAGKRFVPVHVRGVSIRADDHVDRCEDPSVPPPCPYNVNSLLEARDLGEPVFLCKGVINTLTLAQSRCLAVGLVGRDGLQAEWAEHFEDLTIFLAFDSDRAGQTLAYEVTGIFLSEGLPAPHNLSVPEGQEVVEFFRQIATTKPGAILNLEG